VDTRFEAAADAVVAGDLLTLARLLRESPQLTSARSDRPHRATLLHYLAANGVENERQKSPNNAVEVARMLLNGGSEVDLLADMYGCAYTTMSMLVSSTPPAEAGVQEALVETLLDSGAAIEGVGSGRWKSPLLTALAFGHLGAARTLAKRGASIDSLPAVAGLGLLPEASRLLPASSSEERHSALALAAQHGHVEIVRLLLDAGEDPNRYNPPGNHGHSTPMHQAAFYGHKEVVQLLVERRARLDLKDTIYQGTPLGWAEHAGRIEIENYLRAQLA
jgi:hypothetical protein